MKSIEANKDSLLAKLRENRDQHQLRYNEVLAAWRVKVTAVLAEKLMIAESGGDPEVNYLALPRPAGHVQDYDTAIQMLQWEERDVVEIDEVLFRRFVMDQWDWKQSFETTASSYRVT